MARTDPRPRVDPLVRFDRHWRIDSEGCHIWHGSLGGSKGIRPYFKAGTSQTDSPVIAYRWLYKQVIGPIGEGMEIDHICKNSICVNIEHLEQVTPEENQRRTRSDFCQRGHDMTKPENVRKNGMRACVECIRINARARYNRSKAGK